MEVWLLVYYLFRNFSLVEISENIDKHNRFFKKNGLHFFFTICNAEFPVSFALPLGRARGKSKWRVVVGCNWPDFEGALLCACWFKADGWINHCCMVICLGLILFSFI